MFQICDILKRIRILRSAALTNGSGCRCGSVPKSSVNFRMLDDLNWIFSKRIFWIEILFCNHYFSLLDTFMRKGKGSIPVTNGSGRRVRNTDFMYAKNLKFNSLASEQSYCHYSIKVLFFTCWSTPWWLPPIYPEPGRSLALPLSPSHYTLFLLLLKLSEQDAQSQAHQQQYPTSRNLHHC